MKPHISKLTQEDAIAAAGIITGRSYDTCIRMRDGAMRVVHSEHEYPTIDFYLNLVYYEGENPAEINNDAESYLADRYDFSGFPEKATTTNANEKHQKNASEFDLQTARIRCTTKQFIKAMNEKNDIVFEEAKAEVELIDKVIKQFIQSTSTLPQIGMKFVFGSGVFVVKSIEVELHSNLIYIDCKIKENNIA